MARFLASMCLTISLATMSISARADISDATFTPQGPETYAQTEISKVAVYVYKPEFKFKVI